MKSVFHKSARFCRRRLTESVFLCHVFFGVQTAAAEVPYLAFGDIRGNLEPCGCDPKTDFGGIRRLVAQINRERALAKNFYVFNLGNNLPELELKVLSEQEKNKIPYILESISALAPDASLFNYSENLHLKDRSHYLSTNRNGFREEIVLKDAVIFGFTSPTKEFKAEKAQSVLLRTKITGLFAKHKNLKKILLFSGTNEDLLFLRVTYQFDEIISSNIAAVGRPSNKNESENESLLTRKILGEDIWMTPLGGQGILRGGILRKQVAPTIAQIFAKDAKPTTKETAVTWLTKDLDDESVLKDVFTRYRGQSKNSFLKHASDRKLFLKDSQYIGSEACKSCHAESFETWKSTAHAHAYRTLQEKNQHDNLECVSCHVVGFKEKGGFADIKSSPALANVQCENCHGPRREHAGNPSINPAGDPRDMCVTCHKPPHSSEFSFERYWPKIRHTKH